MSLKDPELIKSARVFAIIQWLALIAVLLMAVSLTLPFFIGNDGETLSQQHLGLISLAGTLMSLIILLPVMLMIRSRRQHLTAIDQLLQTGAARPFEMRRKFGFTGLIAFRQPGGTAMPAKAQSSAAGLEPAWWLQPLVTKDRLPPFGSQSTQGYWHPASAGSLLAWRAPKLGWGRVLSAAEIRRQGQQILLILLGFSLFIPLLIGLIVGFLMQSITPPAEAIEALQDSQAQLQLQTQLTRLWFVLAALPLLSLVLAALTWRETKRIAATALDPKQL